MSRRMFWVQILVGCLLAAGPVQVEPCLAQQAAPTTTAAVSLTGNLAGGATLRFLAVDHNGNPVESLQAEELSLQIDKVPRKIVSLSPDKEDPRTFGLFFDTSGSRRSDRLIAQEAYATTKFVESIWRRGDGGFVVVFNDYAYTIAKPTADVHQIQAALQTIPREDYRGGTALYDALCSVHFGPQAGDGEKAFVVVSDFEDNSSRKSKRETIQTMQKEGVRVFIILRPLDEDTHPRTAARDRKTAEEVAEKTGGEAFSVTSETELNGAFRRLAGELRGAYHLTYEPLPASSKPKKLELQSTRPDIELLFAKD